MKKKFLLLIVAVLTCVACVFGFTGCDDDSETEIPANGNMLTTVFEEYTDMNLVNHFVTGGAGWTDGKVEGYTLADLTADKLTYNNYSRFNFKWKSNKYKVTKVEFDVVAQTALDTVFSINNPKPVSKIEVSLNAGQTKHIEFTCDIKRDTGLFYIFNGVKSYEKKGTINWKLTNLYVTAEKI